MPDIYSTIDQLTQLFRADFRKRLAMIPERLEKYHQAAEGLRVLGVSPDEITLHQVVSNILNRWLKEQEESLTLSYQGMGEEQVTFSNLDGRAMNFFLNPADCRAKMSGDSTQDNLASFLERYRFRDLATETLKQVSTLEARGLKRSANNLAKSFHLINYASRSLVRVQKARVVTYTGISSGYGSIPYDTADVRKLRQIARDMSVLESCMGDLSASSCFNEIADILANAGTSFPTHTNHLKGRPVEFRMFKNHMDIRMRHDVLDTVLAFLVMHSDKELIQLEGLAA